MKSVNFKNRQVKLNQQKDWCDTVLKYIYSKSNDSYGLDLFSNAINTGYHLRKLSLFKVLISDLLEWVNGLPEDEIQELDQILIKKFGTGIKSHQKKRFKKIQSIVKKGKITNEDECRLVLDYIDQIYADSSKEDELLKLNALLNKFDDDSKNR